MKHTPNYDKHNSPIVLKVFSQQMRERVFKTLPPVEEYNIIQLLFSQLSLKWFTSIKAGITHNYWF